jgi:gluconate 2-dehydrogenase
MSFAETGKLYKILRFQPIRYGQEYWDNLGNYNENISYTESDAKNRDEFLEEIKSGKFNDVNFIAHTFQSVKETGIFDRELLGLLNKFTKVKGIAHCGAGYDQIDTNACKEFGIQLSNVPDKVSAATADTNIFLILCTTRNFQIGHDNLMKGEWMKHMTGAGTPIGHSIQDKVVGILGMGAIGRAVRDRLSGFGLKKIVYYNRKRLSPEEEKGCEFCDSIDEFLAQSDVISINMPLNSHTHHFINRELVSKMKDGVVIVNTARGPIVDEAAIKEGIKSGKIFGYGADVFENEPNIDMEFVSMPKVVSTPHLGAGTYETVKAMEEVVVQNVESFYKTGKVLNMVPELQEIF